MCKYTINNRSEPALNLPHRKLHIHAMMKHPANTDAEAARRVEAAAESLRRGSGILLTDDEDRENEGDLIFRPKASPSHRWPS